MNNKVAPTPWIAMSRVMLGDNLQSAETVVLVEGLTDEKVIPALLSRVDDRFANFVKSRRVVFRATRGTGKMRPQIQREKATVCRILVVLDDDAAGRQEAKNIRDASLLNSANIFMLGGKSQQSELEDLISPEVYLPALSLHFSQEFLPRHFGNRSKKWSDNLLAAASELGVSEAGDELIDQAKMIVSDAVVARGDSCIRDGFEAHLKALSSLILGGPEAG